MPKSILVTGYGIFRDYARNPSCEAVKLLRKSYENSGEFKQLVEIDFFPEIPVTYEAVDSFCYSKKYDAIIHCGVSHLARTKLTLEMTARGNGYEKLDVKEKSCPIQIDEHLQSSLLLEAISDEICKEKGSCTTSTDAGNYLCEYIYFKALRENKRSVFVHVPCEAIFSVDEVAKELEVFVKKLVETL